LKLKWKEELGLDEAVVLNGLPDCLEKGVVSVKEFHVRHPERGKNVLNPFSDSSKIKSDCFFADFLYLQFSCHLN